MRLTLLLSSLLIALSVTSVYAEDDVLLSDDFSTLKPGWGKADDVQKVEGNKLLFNPAKGTTYTSLYTEQTFGNADIRVKLSCVKGGVDNSGGILFWGTDNNNCYYAQIYTDGMCGVSRRVGGKWIHPVGGKVLAQAKQGIGQVNELRVVTSGDRATLYVNGDPISSFKGFPPAKESKIGLRGESGAEPYTWSFSDFTVRKGPEPTGPPPAADDSLLFADDFATLDPSWGSADAVLSGGNRKLILKPEFDKSATRLYKGRLFEDADIRVQLTLAKGGAGSPAGLVFWAADQRNYYAVFVKPDGTAMISVKTEGDWRSPVVEKQWKPVKTGTGQTNEVRVVTKGNSATAYINGQELGAIGFKGEPGPRQVGVVAESDEVAYTWEFSDFSARKPGAPAAVVKIPPVVPSVAPEGALLFDDFATLKPGWGTATDIRSVADGKLRIQLKPELLYRLFYQDAQFGDADIRIKLSASQGDADEGAGVVFWGVDNANYYAAAVQPDGGFYVMRRTRGKALPTVSSEIRGEVLKGLGQTNELRVVTSGTLVSIYVNDKQVTEFRGFPPAGGGKIGVYAESGTEPSDWAFSDLSVRKAPAPSGPPQDASLLYADDFHALDPAWGSAGPSMKVENNQMVVSLQPSKRRTIFYDGAMFDDVDARLKITDLQGINQPGGLVFWGIDLQNYYAANLSSDGKINVIRYQNGKVLFHAKGKKDEAILPGAGQTNELRVATSGPVATFFVNDKQVLSLRGFPPAGGSKIGLIAESGETPCNWTFADLRVKQGSAPPPPTAPRDQTLLYADDFQSLDPAWGYADESRSVAGGKFQIKVPADDGRIYLNNAALYSDVDFSVKAVSPQGLTDQSLGLIFWGGRTDNYCYFVVETDGSIVASTREGDEFKRTSSLVSKIKWLRTAPGEVNELRVVTQGGKALLYVNGLYAHSYEGTPPEGGGRVGIYAGAGKDAGNFEFSEFRVRTPLVMLPASAGRTDDLLLTDDFRALTWGLPDEYQAVSGNQLLLTPVLRGSRVQFYSGGKVSNADIRVKLSQQKGPADQAAGIAFWALDTKNYYVAFIGSDGRVFVGRREQGKWLRPVPGAINDAVRKGVGQTNDLRVVTSGDRATVYVNDKEMHSFRGFPPRGGSQIGFHAEAGAETTTWAYSDLIVRKGPEPEKSTKPPDLTLLYADDFSTLDPAWGSAPQISTGEKQLQMTPAANSGFDKLYAGRLLDDADMRVKLTLAKGETDLPAGILFWATNYQNYYFASIRTDGRYELYQSKDGKFALVKPSKIAGEIVKGAGQTNELRVVTRGKTATVSINDKEVDTLEAESLPEGGKQFGFHAESGKEACTWAFSDLVIRTPKIIRKLDE